MQVSAGSCERHGRENQERGNLTSGGNDPAEQSFAQRSVYVLTLQVEHKEVYALRALLKRLIRDHGLKCIDIHKLEETDMSDDLFDLNDAETQRDFEVAPPGLYWLAVEVQPGAVADDHLLLAKNGYTLHLKLKCKVKE